MKISRQSLEQIQLWSVVNIEKGVRDSEFKVWAPSIGEKSSWNSL